ncbi:hypothetical protein [Spongiactinospora sp. TRM90649]|uniref:hypothetical protein n=1 Tax=Spongiactinospora sp. TRM90649 TaxID=3031114 RepID=UPI0023F6B9B0|nr:hypothetical protein [Spongiactinospora sp. TRM90649]
MATNNAPKLGVPWPTLRGMVAPGRSIQVPVVVVVKRSDPQMVASWMGAALRTTGLVGLSDTTTLKGRGEWKNGDQFL